ncbi:serine/threonine-protein kinase [Kitasatospora sp. NPDC051853]|uniref:serine/threonine-protein kinase n=1 Tax=Kitasatospora sp. NPDC051853 TaxID=3364058 RepID=UPI0037978EED
MNEYGGTSNTTPGTLLAGRYRLRERLGRGGMGTVWRAEDERMHRQVAVKEPTLPPGVGEQERTELCRRMEREAQAAAAIRHPGVVRVHDIETVDGLPWLVMELIEGESLESWLARGTVDVAEAASTGRQLAAALAAVHAAGVVHRDVKPANVMRTPTGELVLTDFGIAQVEGGVDLTRTGLLVGSVPYLSPERAAGRRPGPAADLWSLGLVLYEALEGVHPFRRLSAESTLVAVVQDPVPEPRRAGPLTGVITALLSRDPDRRPDAAEAERLFALPAAVPTPTEVVAAPLPGPAAPTVALRAAGRPTAPRPRWRRRPLLVGAALAGVAALTAAGLGAWRLLGGPPEPRSVPAGYTAHSYDQLGLGIAVPEGYSTSLGLREANWASPDSRVQIRVKDEGKAERSAEQYARERLALLMKGQGTFCSESKPAPEYFHVETVHGPQSELHGDLDASVIKYRYSTLAEDVYPCLSHDPVDEATEQYLVRDGRVLHLTFRFVRQNVKDGPAADNRTVYDNVNRSIDLG